MLRKNTTFVWLGVSILLPTLVGTAALSLPTQKEPAKSMKSQSSSSNAPTNWKSELKKGQSLMQQLDDVDFSLQENQGYNGQMRLERLAHQAEVHLRNALDGAQSKATDDEISTILLTLSKSLVWQKRSVEAKTLVLSAKALRQKHHPRESIEVAECLTSLVGFAQTDGKERQAEDLALDAYDIYMKLLPRNDAHFCGVLPVIGAYTHDRKESAAYYGQYVEAMEKRYGKRSPKLKLPLRLYAAALANNHQHNEAVKVYERCVALYKLNPSKDKYDLSPVQHMEEARGVAEGKYGHVCSEDEPNKPGRRTQRLAGLVKSTADDAWNSKPTVRQKYEKYGLFDNKSMDDLLQKAEALAAANDLSAAKSQWTKVLNFMHEPGWFPSAAAFPISSRFASLANTCMERQQFSDADSLLRGAMDFPFHQPNEVAQIDASAEKLFKHYEKNDLVALRSFLRHAIEKVNEPRKETYKKWLNSIPPDVWCEGGK